MRWHSLSTAHFDIHYYEGEEVLAAKVARIAEDVYAKLVPLFGTTPADRTQIVLTDHVDAANGLTTTVPYDHIVLYAYPPEADGELGSYDDYVHMLFVHEYAHVLHMNTVGGIPKALNTVLGKTYLPNSVAPSWLVEGLAVTVESRVTGQGRYGSSRTRMILRAALLDDQWLTLPELTEAPLKRPRASAWYLYGGELISWVAEQVGLDRLRDYLKSYGRRIIPYGINLLAKQTLGKSWWDFYLEWTALTRAREEARVAAIEEEGVVAGTPLTTNGEEHRSPRFSPEGRFVAYLQNDGHVRQHVRVHDLATGRSRLVAECDGYCHHLAWMPDGRRLLVTRTAYEGLVYRYRQLFEVDVRTGRERQVTHGLRVREIDVSPDGTHVAFVTTAVGKTSLALLELASGELRFLVEPEGFDQLAAPRFSPDGRRIAYSAWVDGDGRRDLFVVDVEGGSPRRVTWDAALDLDPAWSADGAHLLFASDPDGVYNIYALRLADGARFRVTNVRTGAFSPDVDAAGQRIVFRRYGGQGYDVHVLGYAPASWRAVGSAGPAPPSSAPYVEPDTKVGEATSYNPLPTLRPFRWEPTWSIDQDGLGAVGLRVSGKDAVGQHYWLTALDYAVSSQTLSELFVYTNRMLPVDIGVSFSHLTWERLAFFRDQLQRYDERVLAGSLDLAVPIPHVRRGVSVSAGYTFRLTMEVDRPAIEHDPADLVPFIPEEGLLSGVYVGLSYSDVESSTFGFTGEKGRSVGLRYTANHPYLGSDFETHVLRWTWKEYLRSPWALHHVFVLKLQGGIRWGHDEFRGVYQLGGIPDQELFVALVNQEPLGSGARLRGFATGAFAGRQFHLLNAEYRFPILDIFRGLDTLPVWASRLTGAVFVDVGDAADELEQLEPNVGVGAELRLQTTLYYGVFPADLRLGYAYGVYGPGEHQVYFLLGAWP